MTAPRALSGGDLAEVVAELYSAVHAPEDDMVVAVLRAAGRADGVAVSYTEAAKRLRVSVPTVDSWVQRGVLERVAEASVRSVSATSLGRPCRCCGNSMTSSRRSASSCGWPKTCATATCLRRRCRPRRRSGPRQ